MPARRPSSGPVAGTRFKTSSNAENGFARAKLDNIQFYSCYAPPSLSLNEFTGFLDRLTKDVKEHSLVAIAGDFNA